MAAATLAWEAYQAWQRGDFAAPGQFKRGETKSGVEAPGYVPDLNCGGGGQATYTAGFNNCGADQIVTGNAFGHQWDIAPNTFWTWSFTRQRNPPVFNSYWYARGTRYQKVDVNAPPPKLWSTGPFGDPTVLPPRYLPHAPDAPPFDPWPVPRKYQGHPRPGERTYGPRPRPDPRPTPGYRPQPPRKFEKEGKSTAQKAFAKAVRVAWAATEAADAVEAIFDALPPEIRATVPKSGRLSPGAFGPQGTPYATALDKARHIYRHFDKLDRAQAFQNLVVNHLTDEIAGRVFGTADDYAQSVGINGFGHAMTPFG